MKTYFYSIVFTVIIFCSSCSKHITPFIANPLAITTIPDYSNINYWAAHPLKNDYADSISKQLVTDYKQDTSVDVFFIHPTTLTSVNDKRWNAPIDDSKINLITDKSTILYQASVFNQHRLFAPRYKQAHIQAFYAEPKTATPFFDIAYEDVKAAFEYYLKNFNNGKPFIIASHSQGTLHAARLLKEYFENKPLQKQLVCAYIIGMPIATSYFTAIQPCTNAGQTGCFISWRTYKKKSEGTKYVQKENFNSVVVNPLTWSMDTLPVSAKYNKGGILRNYNKIVPGVVSTQIHKNILWSSKPKFFGNIFLTTKNYHIADYNLFYMNIRENVKERILAYWKIQAP